MAEPQAEAHGPANPRDLNKVIEEYKPYSADSRGSDRRESNEKPSIKLTAKGWLLRWKNREALIFDDIMSSEADFEIAEKLGITPTEAWKLKQEALEKWWPRTLDELRLLFPQVIGEDENIKLVIDALASLKLRDREERLMGIIIEAKNSAGKKSFSRRHPETI